VIASDDLLAPGITPSLEYYLSQDSFSEAENTKATLEALCQRFRTEIQAKRLADHQSVAQASTYNPISEPHLTNAIADLDQAMREFSGTEQEMEIAQDLLLALKKAGRYDRWLDVYLTALYEHPTLPVVSRFAGDALVIGKRCGETKRVRAGLDHLLEIPFDFKGRESIESAELRANHANLARK